MSKPTNTQTHGSAAQSACTHTNNTNPHATADPYHSLKLKYITQQTLKKFMIQQTPKE